MFGSKEKPIPQEKEQEGEFTLENMEKQPHYEVHLDDGSKVLVPFGKDDMETGRANDILEECFKLGPSYLGDDGRMVFFPPFRIKKIVKFAQDGKEGEKAGKRRLAYEKMFVPATKKED